MLRDLLFRLRSLVFRSALDRQLEEEVRFHLDRQVEAYVSAGLPRPEAEARARREFGSQALTYEDARESRGAASVENLFRDVRFGIRVLARSRVFTLVAVSSLALGIGANTAIFTLFDAIRLRSLPVKAPQELVRVRVADMSGARGAVNRPESLTYRIWDQIRERQQAFSPVFAWSPSSLNLAPEGQVRMERALWVSGEFFSALGLEPAAGRLISPSDDRPGCTPMAVISYPFWKKQFAAEPSAIGGMLTLNGRSVEIAGVAPDGFFGLEVGEAFSLALPICAEPAIRGFNALEAGTYWWLTVMGRLKAGTSAESASAQMRAISAGVFDTSLPPTYPQVSVANYRAMQLIAEPAAAGTSELRNDYSDSLQLLLGIAGLVLLIACANLANLMLARASVRAREIAVRLAIGASRGRLLVQLMIENLLIAIAGAAVGLVLSRELSRILVTRLTPDPKSIYLDVTADWRVLGFTASLAILTCLLFGLAPAWRATAAGPGIVLKQFGRGLAGSHERFSIRRLLAASQVALSMVLLTGTLLFTGSLRNLLHVDTGFRSRGVLLADLGYSRATPLKIPPADYQRMLLERVAAVPGVESVADATVLPLSGMSWGNRAWREGAEPGQAIDSPWSRVSAGYFRTLGVRLLAGRDFDARDGKQAPNVAIVSREFARRIMNSDAPVGQRFRIEATPSTPELTYEIVGIAADTKYRTLREPTRPIFYLALAQDPTPQLQDTLLIRTTLPFATVIPGVREAIRGVDAGTRFEFGAMTDLIDGSLLRERLMASLSTAFGILAGILAAIGLYGVMACTVAQRTNEIGVRVALGATPMEILRMVIGESGRVVAAGISAGVLLTLWAAEFARKLLFGIPPRDAATLATAALLLCAVAFLAVWLPARKASRLDPTVALREE